MLMKASPSPFIHYFQPKAKYQMDASTHGRRTDSFLAADPIIDEDGHANVNDFFNKVHRVSDFSESPAHQKLFPPTPKTEIEPQSILESQQNNDYQNDIIIEEEEESDSIPEEKEEKHSANHSKLSISDVSSAESPIRKSKNFSPNSSSTDSDSEKSENDDCDNDD